MSMQPQIFFLIQPHESSNNMYIDRGIYYIQIYAITKKKKEKKRKKKGTHVVPYQPCAGCGGDERMDVGVLVRGASLGTSVRGTVGVWARWWVSMLAHWHRHVGVSRWVCWHAGIGMWGCIGMSGWVSGHVHTFACWCKWVSVCRCVGVLAHICAMARMCVLARWHVRVWHFSLGLCEEGALEHGMGLFRHPYCAIDCGGDIEQGLLRRHGLSMTRRGQIQLSDHRGMYRMEFQYLRACSSMIGICQVILFLICVINSTNPRTTLCHTQHGWSAILCWFFGWIMVDSWQLPQQYPTFLYCMGYSKKSDLTELILSYPKNILTVSNTL